MKKIVLITISCLMIALILSCSDGPKKTNANQSLNSQVSEKKNAGPNGQKIYTQFCQTCHGKEGNDAISGAKDLTKSTMSLTEVKNIIINGGKNPSMIAYGKLLKPKQIEAVADYVMKFR